MSAMNPERSHYGVVIQPTESLFYPEPGEILSDHIDDWAQRGISQNNMLQAIQEIGRNLRGDEKRALGAWITEKARQYDSKQDGTQQGELEWQQ